MSIKKRAACFITIWLLLSIGLEGVILRDIATASPVANEEIRAAAAGLSDLFLSFGFEADEQISGGYITFRRDRDEERSASHVKGTLTHSGTLELIRGDISFSTQQSADSIYADMETIASFLVETLADDKEKILEAIRVIQSDEPKVITGSSGEIGWSVSSASDRTQARCIIFSFSCEWT